MTPAAAAAVPSVASVATGTGPAPDVPPLPPLPRVELPRLVKETPTAPPPPGGLWAWLKKHVTAHALGLVASAGLAIAATVLGLALPKLAGEFWDAFGAASDVSAFLGPALKLAALAVGRFLLQLASSTLLANSTEGVAASLRAELYKRLLAADVALFDASQTNELVAALSDDVKEVRDALRAVLGDGVNAAARVLGGAASLWFLSRKLSLALAGALVPMFAIGNGMAARLRRKARRSAEAAAAASAAAGEALGGVRTVKAFTAEEEEAARYAGLLERASRASRSVAREFSFFQGTVALGLTALSGGVLALGAHLVAAGEMTRGGVTSFALQAAQLEGSLEGLSMLSARLAKAKGAASRLGVLLAQQPTVAAGSGSERWADLRGDIAFSNVTFAYPIRPDTPVLRGATLHIPAGKTTALVGKSGSGKSTVAALIAGFYDPSGGAITVDGRPLPAVDGRWLRAHTAFVEQQPALFSGTVRDALCYGASGSALHGALVQQEQQPQPGGAAPSSSRAATAACPLSEASLLEAASQANALPFITGLPQGLDTPVGERGGRLSGGQKQRIRLATALARQPRILILDEPTSALDSESEAVVAEALRSAAKGRTTLVVAHRLSTVRDADLIHVLEAGRVVESGSHEELLAKEGRYAALVAKQQGLHLAPGTLVDTLVEVTAGKGR